MLLLDMFEQALGSCCDEHIDNLKAVVEIGVWHLPNIGVGYETHQWSNSGSAFTQLANVPHVLIIHCDDVVKHIEVGFLQPATLTRVLDAVLLQHEA